MQIGSPNNKQPSPTFPNVQLGCHTNSPTTQNSPNKSTSLAFVMIAGCGAGAQEQPVPIQLRCCTALLGAAGLPKFEHRQAYWAGYPRFANSAELSHQCVRVRLLSALRVGEGCRSSTGGGSWCQAEEASDGGMWISRHAGRLHPCYQGRQGWPLCRLPNCFRSTSKPKCLDLPSDMLRGIPSSLATTKWGSGHS